MAGRLVVIGADAAGMARPRRLGAAGARDECDIVAFERGNFSSYSACGIPYKLAPSYVRVARTTLQVGDEVRVT